MMWVTEIVQAANDLHAGFEGLDFTGQGASSPGKAIEALAKGRIETLNESSIDHASALRLLDERLDHRFTALHNAPRDVQLSIHSLLDDLHNGDIGPGNQLWASQFPLTPWPSGSKGLPKGGYVACQTIHRQQQGATERQIPDLVGQNLDQIQIPVWTDRPTQPQTGRYHDC